MILALLPWQPFLEPWLCVIFPPPLPRISELKQYNSADTLSAVVWASCTGAPFLGTLGLSRCLADTGRDCHGEDAQAHGRSGKAVYWRREEKKSHAGVERWRHALLVALAPRELARRDCPCRAVTVQGVPRLNPVTHKGGGLQVCEPEQRPEIVQRDTDLSQEKEGYTCVEEWRGKEGWAFRERTWQW